MAIGYRDSSTATASGTTAVDVAVPAGAVADSDRLLLLIADLHPTGGTTRSVAPSGWTKIARWTQSADGSDLDFMLAHRAYLSTDPATLSISAADSDVSSSVMAALVAIQETLGLNTHGHLEAGAGVAPVSPTVVPSADGCLEIYTYYYGGADLSPALDGSLTAIATVHTLAATLALGYKVQASGGVASDALTLTPGSGPVSPGSLSTVSAWTPSAVSGGGGGETPPADPPAPGKVSVHVSYTRKGIA